ncbi:MAG: LysR family transcriptional regulator, partial [Rhodoferax sp.]|nr:LysR family transcriptional regulator [Rhodoferax sp.]
PDLNELFYFVAVVRHRGFSAASRATGIEKTRLSRRVAELERKLKTRLLQRTTRSIALTEAGERFFERCVATIEEAEAAYECIASLHKEPVGTVRMSCPLVLAQTYLPSILPGFMDTHQKDNLVIDLSDRDVDLIDERYDLALFSRPDIGSMPGIVVRKLGSARRILVASPSFLDRAVRPTVPDNLEFLATFGRSVDVRDSKVRWELASRNGQQCVIKLSPRLQTNDLRLQFESAINGIGIALLPEPIVAASIKSKLLEHVLPDWFAPSNQLCLAYPSPRGILPSVRSVIEYFTENLPAIIQERSAVTDAAG